MRSLRALLIGCDVSAIPERLRVYSSPLADAIGNRRSAAALSGIAPLVVLHCASAPPTITAAAAAAAAAAAVVVVVVVVVALSWRFFWWSAL